MWEEEKKKKGKTERLFSNGVIILIFLILAAQSVFFTKHIIDNRRDQRAADTAGNAAVHNIPQKPDIQTSYEPESGNRKTEHTEQKAKKRPDPKTVPGTAPESTAATPCPAGSTVGETVRNRKTRQHDEYGYDGWKWDMVELNSADSAALDALPGIGPWYTRQILSYRERLGSYADINQLLDIRGFDTARLNRLADRIYIEPESVRRLDLRTMPLDSMAAHPYIGPYAAKGIDRLRRTVPDTVFSIQTIVDNGTLHAAQARRLSLYIRAD